MKKACLLLCIVSIFISCEREKFVPSAPVPADLHGVFVVNEGAFGAANGAISFKRTDNGYFIRDIYKEANNQSLGDIVQSFTVHNSTGYVVVNNSFKVEIVNMKGFAKSGTITGFSSPRFLLPVSDTKAYVSDWFSNDVKIVDLAAKSVTGSIPAGAGPEQMLKVDGKVYVCNVGGFGLDSTVTVIDPATDAVITTIHTGVNPGSLVKDDAGNILVLCSGSTGPDFMGGTADDIGSSVCVINPSTNTVSNIFQLGQFVHPIKLASNTDGSKIYMLYGDDGYSGVIKEFNKTTGNCTLVVNENFYGFGVNPENGDLYGGRYGFSANCYLLHYSSNALLIDSVEVGIGPNNCVFY